MQLAKCNEDTYQYHSAENMLDLHRAGKQLGEN